ncbi:hypothetical protein [Methylobacterium sp. J-070]|uniref:hypothetical protein n=1 Tax=Methylobacterium sp. J-070 TaxID=2836650 RepID=UPI001FBBDB68|nr:hypothetical protein [Methylobacterium sp. J-070]MCJ2053609.1 hypothetical protein [Methylobacterium sp. J-070]
MARSRNTLVADLLEAADTRAAQTGRQNLRETAMRRALSSAYHAAFHELCYVCADQFGVWTKGEDLREPVYRLVDHGIARSRRTGKEAAGIAPDILRIGTLFKDLQEARHSADYTSSAMPVSQGWALSQIAEARRIVERIEAPTPEDRLKPAILLVTKAR